MLFALHHAEEEISIQQGVARRRVHVGPFRVRTAAIDLQRVERVRVQTKERLARDCVLVSDDAMIRLGRAREKPALLWLKAWLQSRMS